MSNEEDEKLIGMMGRIIGLFERLIFDSPEVSGELKTLIELGYNAQVFVTFTPQQNPSNLSEQITIQDREFLRSLSITPDAPETEKEERTNENEQSS